MERVILSGYEALEVLMRKRQEMEEAREERFISVFGALQEMGVLSVLEQAKSEVVVEPSVNIEPVRHVRWSTDVMPVLNQILNVLQQDKEEASRLRELERSVLERLLAKLT